MTNTKYRIVSVGEQLGMGAAGSHYLRISAVAKQNSDKVPYCIPNEFISAEIGRFLGLPVPPCGICRQPEKNASDWFASLDFNLEGDTLPPVDPLKCVTELPRFSTGLLLFDVLIGNNDRHNRNLSVDFLAKPPIMSVFDHSHALLGHTKDQGKKTLEDSLDNLVLSKHCLLKVLPTDEYFSVWFERIARIPDFFLESRIEEVIGLGIDEEEAKAAYKFLQHRRDEIGEIVKQNRKGLASGYFLDALTWLELQEQRPVLFPARVDSAGKRFAKRIAKLARNSNDTDVTRIVRGMLAEFER